MSDPKLSDDEIEAYADHLEIEACAYDKRTQERPPLTETNCWRSAQIIKTLLAERRARIEADERALAGAALALQDLADEWTHPARADQRQALLALLRREAELREQLKAADAIVLSHSKHMVEGLEKLAALEAQHHDELRRACERAWVLGFNYCAQLFNVRQADGIDTHLRRDRDLNSILARDTEGQ